MIIRIVKNQTLLFIPCLACVKILVWQCEKRKTKECSTKNNNYGNFSMLKVPHVSYISYLTPWKWRMPLLWLQYYSSGGIFISHCRNLNDVGSIWAIHNKMYMHGIIKYSRLSLTRSRDSLTYFEIYVPRHIRFAALSEKKIEWPYFIHEFVIWLPKLEIYWKYCGKEEKLLLRAISPLFHNICCMLLNFHVKTGTRFSLRDKRLFEISEVEITRVDCINTY